MERLAILGVDPGETTGWAAWWGPVDPEVGLWENWAKGSWRAGEFTAGAGVAGVQEVWGLLWEEWLAVRREYGASAVWIGVERWTAGADVQGGRDIASAIGWGLLGWRGGAEWQLRELTGLDASRWGPCHVEMQAPSRAKSLATPKRMRAAGAWQVGQPHARDALKHSILGLSLALPWLRGV